MWDQTQKAMGIVPVIYVNLKRPKIHRNNKDNWQSFVWTVLGQKMLLGQCVTSSGLYVVMGIANLKSTEKAINTHKSFLVVVLKS